MTIQPFAAGSYLADRNTASLVGLKSRLDALTTQLATGRAAETYGGLGAGRATSLSAHATISALDGYTAAIDGASTRVNLASRSLTQLKTLADDTRSSLLSSLQSTTSAGIGNSDSLARTKFYAAVDAPFVGDGFTRWVDGQYALGTPELGLANWQYGRMLARGGVLSGDSVHTIRYRASISDPSLHR